VNDLHCEPFNHVRWTLTWLNARGWPTRRAQAGETYTLSRIRTSGRQMLATVGEVRGRARTCVKVPFALARSTASVMPCKNRFSTLHGKHRDLDINVTSGFIVGLCQAGTRSNNWRHWPA
jgi:hypothetical protein